MAKASFVSVGHDGMRCTITSDLDLILTLEGVLADPLPTRSGDAELLDNPSLVTNLWAYAKHEKLRRKTRSQSGKKHFAQQAAEFLNVAEELADLASRPSRKSVKAWCSSCFSNAQHNDVDGPPGNLPAWLCQSCGAATLGCAAPRCPHMASRSQSRVKLPRFCAEHRHDITGFEKASACFGPLENYESFLRYESKNLSKGSKLALFSVLAGGAAVTGGAALAPAIGGAIGSAAGLSGAAASSFGLAALGGGSLAAGGFGMAGGTLVVAAGGGLLGTAAGAGVTNAYLGQDESFRIEKLKPGTGTPVIVASGFLTEGQQGWGNWRPLIEKRYPDAPVYRVFWGAKELKALGALVGVGAGRQASAYWLKQAAARATKSGARLVPPAFAAMTALDLMKNPWHTARAKADQTGVALAGLMARTDAQAYILVGHSLGARLMLTAASLLVTDAQAPRLEAVHLLGAAVGTNGDLRPINAAVQDKLANYYSANDKVLRYLYRAAQAGSQPAGLTGFKAKLPSIRDYNVSKKVAGHSDYVANVRLR